MAKILSVSCYKGGVGKTTACASIGGILSRKEKVLLVDLDPQGNLTSTFISKNFTRNVYDMFEDRAFREMEIEDIELPIYHAKDNIDIIPADLRASDIEAKIVSVSGREFILADLLGKVRDKYGWIIIDCPAQVGVALENSLVATDYVISPFTPDKYANDGLEIIFKLVKRIHNPRLNPNVRFLGVFLNRYISRRMVDQVALESVNERYEGFLFDTKIRENSSFAKAALMGQDIYSFDPESNGAVDFLALVDEMNKKIAEQ